MGLSGRNAEASSRREACGPGKETGRAVLGTSTQTYKPQVPLWVLVRHSSGRLVNNGEEFHFVIHSFIKLKRILGMWMGVWVTKEWEGGCWIPWSWCYPQLSAVWSGCWEEDSDHYQEQFLTTEPSVQSSALPQHISFLSRDSHLHMGRCTQMWGLQVHHKNRRLVHV